MGKEASAAKSKAHSFEVRRNGLIIPIWNPYIVPFFKKTLGFGTEILAVCPMPTHCVGLISSGQSCTVTGHQVVDLELVGMHGHDEFGTKVVVVNVEVVLVVVVVEVVVVDVLVVVVLVWVRLVLFV